ncbi:type I secretion C-terminal target domain-containing protein [Nostoc sp. B(2019)]|nr:type I secretion C-terminal target domain-containing protein [Nostoc sp. B(2019)]
MVKPDLIVSSVTASLLGYVSNNLDVSWTVINQGEAITTANWYDGIYLSGDEFPDDSDLFITSISSQNNTSLAVGDSYTTTQSIYIPAIVDSRYLLFATDINNYQSETNEDNNVFAQPINLSASELVISNITAPSSVVLGETIRVYWTVTNQGNAIAFANSSDNIYISSEPYLVVGRSQNFALLGSRSKAGDIPLAPGTSYTASADIIFTRDYLTELLSYGGDPSLVFIASGDEYTTDQDYYYENKNQQAIKIQLNAPNLVVSDATALTSTQTDRTIDVSWTVINQGTVYAPADWSDAIYFSIDDVFDESDLKVASVFTGEQTPLTAGASYTLSQTVSIPNNVAGKGYLLFVADEYNLYYLDDKQFRTTGNQGEINENDNVRAVQIELPGSDLVVDSAIVPTSTALGETISVSWTVKNQSIYTATAKWYDTVYISDDPFLDNSDRSITLQATEVDSSLPGGASYTVTQNITIPEYRGFSYLLFEANSYKNQGETDRTNNVLAKPITLIAPNLVVTNATVSTLPRLGQTYSVSWTVKNQSSFLASADWEDFVYLSTDDVLDDSDTFITSRSAANNTPLAAGVSYTVTKNITLPGTKLDANSNYYLLFAADRYGNQGETNETDNVLAKPISLSAPDLVVTNATTPTSGVLGQIVSLSWTIKNQGGFPTFNYWSNHIFLSTDDVLDDSDTFLAAQGVETPLAAGASYTASEDIILPGIALGSNSNYYLLVVTDRGNYQSETNETNNVLAKQISLFAPDLVVTNAIAPTSAVLNQTFSVSWTVKNQGSFTASANWYDYIYLSTDDVLDNNDTRIQFSAKNNTLLTAGASYTSTQNISLPSITLGTNSNYYLLFVADDYNKQGETDKTNNVLAKQINLSAPDLVITSASATGSNKTVSASWTVKNQGSSPAYANWYDYIYLSTDDVLDDSDTFLSSQSAYNTPLAAGASYTSTQDITITLPSFRLDSNYYLLFVVGNNQGETDKTNNVLAKQISLSPADLVVTNAIAPTSAVLGETLSLSWTVTNQSDFSAFADWYDFVYLSADDVLDSSDNYVISRSAINDTPLVAGASYTATQNVTLPNIALGSNSNYYLLFATDRYNDQDETDETNNVLAKPISLSVPDLVVTNATVPASITLGKTLSVSWTVENQGSSPSPTDWHDFVYLSTDDVLDDNDISLTSRWAGNDTPLAAGVSYTATQNITLPLPTQVGDGNYYLLFVTDKYNKQSETDETNNVLAKPISVTAPDLIISNATSPISAVLGETVSVSWTVKNQGTVTAIADWNDYVYISDDQIWDSSDIYFTNRPAADETPLAAGASYTATQDITISNYAPLGSRYLLFVTDNSNQQGETNETNNVLAKPISLAVLSAGVTIAETDGSTNVIEGGATDTYTVALTSQPTADVAIAINPTAQVTADVNTLTFTAANWNQAQTITVAAVDDDVVEGNHTSTLTLTATSADASYNNIAINSINVSITDNDQLINGTSGRDTLVGSNGTDIITGFKGKDILTGGAGSDQFVYTSIRDAGDEITDFVAGTDKIVLLTLFQSLNLDNLNYESATTQGYLSFGTKGSNTTVLIDSDGLGGRGRSTTLLTVQGLDQATLANADNFLF